MKLIATVKNDDGNVTITYAKPVKFGNQVDTVEPGYLVQIYSPGCLLPILIVAALIAALL